MFIPLVIWGTIGPIRNQLPPLLGPMSSHRRLYRLGLLPLSLLCLASPTLASPTLAQVKVTPSTSERSALNTSNLETLVNAVENTKLPLKQRIVAIVSIGKMGQDAANAVTVLKASLTDRNAVEIRLRSAEALASIGSKALPALPELLILLKDPNPLVRAAAANAIGKLEGVGQQVVPSLIDALEDPNVLVRINAINALSSFGRDAQPALPQLIEGLNTNDRSIRKVIINALGRLGKESKPAAQGLSHLIQESDTETSLAALMALSQIGSEANVAVPEVGKALSSDSPEIRTFAALTLGRMGEAAEPVLPDLRRALQDTDKNVRLNAAAGLGKITSNTSETLAALAEALKDNDLGVRMSAASSINRLAGHVQDQAAKFSRDDLSAIITTLNQVSTFFEDPKNNTNEEVRNSLRRSLIAIKAAKASRYLDQLLEWCRENPAFALIALYIFATPGFWLLVLLLKPLWLLKINDLLKPYTDFELPTPLGNTIKVPLRFVMFLGWLHYHPRVLDAWVDRQLSIAHDAFANKSTVNDRRVYIPIPVVLQGNSVAEISNKDIQSTFLDGRQCVLIWGEGGIGKTSLACQLAQWSMAEDRSKRLCLHRMIPVLIEQELDFKVNEGKDPFRAAIRGQLQALVDSAEPLSDEFIEKLLRQRRVLVIVDRMSELSDATRREIRPGHPDFPANALVVTSRVEENLDNVPKTLLRPMRIEGNRLSSFLETYLTQCNKRELFTDSEYFDACSQLSKMVGQRNITVLLAKLYAEQLIAHKSGIVDSHLPDNIPDLMLSYLNELNRDHNESEPDNPTVHLVSKVIAWECLKYAFRPAPVKRETILSELELACGIDRETAKNHLRHLESRLRILQTVGPAQDQISFSLDPLAECLAALYLVELYGNENYLWQNFMIQADAMPGAPESIHGFLLALRDCCLTRGVEMDIPENVLNELGQRVGLSTEMLRRTQIEQRLARLVPKLADGILDTRLRAIRDLGDLGSAAKPVLPALVREIHASEWQIRQEVIKTIGLMGSEGRNAIPVLVDRMRDEDRRVACEAVVSLGKIGTSAIPALVSALDSKTAYIRSAAAWVLANFEDSASAAVPALRKVLQDQDWQVRWVAAYTLGAIGSSAKEAVPDLITICKCHHSLVRQEASRALWRINGEEASKIVTALSR
jgi:HEAT repeat protein